MKIYPNKAIVSIKKEVNSVIDIPLAYVDTTVSTYSITTSSDDTYKVSSKSEVLPYNNINTNICLFDQFENQIPYDDMVKEFSNDGKDGYVYIPKNSSTKFKPKTFEYKLKVRRNMKYQSNMLYNINALFYNNSVYANRLMPIFGDAASRSLAPGNVSINNSDMSLTKLLNGDISTKDIAFFYLHNLNTVITEGGIQSIFNKNNYIKENDTNLVLVMSDNFALKDYDGVEYNADKVNLFFNYGYTQYKVSNPSIYSGSFLNSKYYFNIPQSTTTVKYTSLFSDTSRTPILIEEHLDNSIVVYIAEDLINNATSNYKILYEMLMYLYINSYQTSDTIIDWISDVMPDYIVKDNKLIKKSKFTSSSSVQELTGLKYSEIKFTNVIIDSDKYPFVKYDGITNNYLTFSKLKGANNIYADPKEKPAGWISLYTNEEIFFYKSFIYRINDSIVDCVNVQRIEDEVIIELKPFRHSDSGIFIKYNQEPIKIPLVEVINNIEQQVINATYYLICKQNDSVSQYELLKKTDYVSTDGVILMTINIAQDTSKTENTLYDMRQRGGGLPLDAKDNFDCFDIGHILGRPYRKAGSLIITLPKYLEEHKDAVMDIVKQYMLAEDYPIIIFKED